MADVVTPEKLPADPLTQLQTSAADLIAWLKSGAEQGADFVMEQAPLLAQEIVAWEICYHGVILLFLLLGFAAVVVVCRKLFGWVKHGEDKFGVGLVSAIIAVFLAFFIAINLNAMIRPIVAPRLVILEKAAELLR